MIVERGGICRPGEAFGMPARVTGARRIGEERAYSVSERGRCSRYDAPCGGVGHDLARAASVGDDDRGAAGERLDPGVGESFRRRGECGHIGGGEPAWKLRVRYAAEQADTVAEAALVDQLLQSGALGSFSGDR